MSETTTITVTDLVREVRKIAAENPNFRYRDYLDPVDTSCVYNPKGGKPSCIIGQAFINLGRPLSSAYEGQNVSTVLWKEGIDADYSVGTAWLMSVQESQDTGATWGNAVRNADEVYPNV